MHYPYTRAICEIPAFKEVVQDTFLAAWESRGTFREQASVRTWLTGILKHKIVDLMRREGREADRIAEMHDTQALDALYAKDGHGLIPGTGWKGDPASVVERDEFWTCFEACVAKLPDRAARVFVLREVDQVASQDICKVLGISPTNYWVILHRARLKLRECLEMNWFGQEGR
jgi:RNA polymerase sigma-70 factor, ECF subfamily